MFFHIIIIFYWTSYWTFNSLLYLFLLIFHLNTLKRINRLVSVIKKLFSWRRFFTWASLWHRSLLYTVSHTAFYCLLDNLLSFTSFLLEKLFFTNILAFVKIFILLFFLEVIYDFLCRYFFVILAKLKRFWLVDFSTWFCWWRNGRRISWVKIECFAQWWFCCFWCVFVRFLLKLLVDVNLKWLFYQFLWRFFIHVYCGRSKSLNLKFFIIIA